MVTLPPWVGAATPDGVATYIGALVVVDTSKVLKTELIAELSAELIELSRAAVLVGVVAEAEETLSEVMLGLAVLWGSLGSIVMSVMKHHDCLLIG